MDLINRDDVKRLLLENAYDDGVIDMEVDELIDEVNEIPSARPKGRWIIKDNPGTGWYRITCSECGEDVTSEAPCIGFFPNAKVAWDFCPYCGSENRGVE